MNLINKTYIVYCLMFIYKKVVISVSKIKSELVARTQFLPKNVVNLQNFAKLYNVLQIVYTF